jgi:glycosyltransferase involved in cell wall biosynthesis
VPDSIGDGSDAQGSVDWDRSDMLHGQDSLPASVYTENFEGLLLSSLSVIVITKNEAHNIAACLKSVSFADQVIVLDSSSSDDTRRIAIDMGAEVSQAVDWKGFGVQKNRALALADRDWVLSIDADERVTSLLQYEIRSVLANPTCEVYALPRLSSYCGQYMRHSGWYPDRIVRLFKRGTAVFSDELVHERVITACVPGVLEHPLLHESFTSFEGVLDKVNRYSTAGAQILLERGKTGSIGKAIAHGLWAFLRTYILRLGFLDGRMGLLLAISNAEGTYYRYLKLWLLMRQRNHVPKESGDISSR